MDNSEEDQKSEFTVKLNNQVIDKIEMDKKDMQEAFDDDFLNANTLKADGSNFNSRWIGDGLDINNDQLIEQSPYFGADRLPPLALEGKQSEPVGLNKEPFLTNERAFVKVRSGTTKKKRRRKKSIIELNNMSL